MTQSDYSCPVNFELKVEISQLMRFDTYTRGDQKVREKVIKSYYFYLL